MSKYDEEIAKKVIDGSYFTDARDWYMQQYLFPITQRSVLMIIAIVLCVCVGLLALNLSAIMKTGNREVSFPIKVENSNDYFSYIKPIAKEDDTTQEAVARYFITDYVKTREEYFPKEMSRKNFKYRLKKIKSSSSKSVLNEYKNYMSEFNPYSPFSRYKDRAIREIKIKSFEFIGTDKTSGQAKVRYEAKVTERKAGEEEKITKSVWESTVHFRLPDIETIARAGTPLRFVVKFYRARLIK